MGWGAVYVRSALTLASTPKVKDCERLLLCPAHRRTGLPATRLWDRIAVSLPAPVVKLVDTRDLKSLDFGRAGSIPARGTITAKPS